MSAQRRGGYRLVYGFAGEKPIFAPRIIKETSRIRTTFVNAMNRRSTPNRLASRTNREPSGGLLATDSSCLRSVASVNLARMRGGRSSHQGAESRPLKRLGVIVNLFVRAGDAIISPHSGTEWEEKWKKPTIKGK